MAGQNNELWDVLTDRYPIAVEHFKKYIDDYKGKVIWDQIFDPNYSYNKKHNLPTNLNSPKFHNLPIELQVGVVIMFISEMNIIPTIYNYLGRGSGALTTNSYIELFDFCFQTVNYKLQSQ